VYGKTRNDKILFAAMLGLVAVALGGSLWAWLGSSTCKACSGARELLAGANLAPVGAVFYGVLFALGTILGRSRLFFSGLLLAASAHVVLLTLLYQRGVFCSPCLLVGGSVVLGAAVSFWADTDNLARGSVLLPVGAVLTHAAVFAVGFFHPPSTAEALAALPQPQAEATVAPKPGTAKLLVFTRSGCRYCDEFEDVVLPELLREFPGRLDVGRESAPASLPTPTIVISGEARTVFPGLPPLADLREAVLRALGKVTHESSMLPKPR
jgi:hypothetical protein